MADVPDRRASAGSRPRHAEAETRFGGGNGSNQTTIIFYEKQLESDPGWAMSEGSRHFEEKSSVFQALQKITKRLYELGIPYAVVGGMALFQHGFRRFTEDIDILVTKEDLKKIHNGLDGLGYLPPFKMSKNLRDTELGVRIEFLTTGDYPGDGLAKPVAFPEPGSVSFEADGVRYINLPSLVELKLASGMTSPGRLKDLADVLELIKIRNLPGTFVDQLNPFVRDKFRELWGLARRRYVTLWRDKRLTAHARTIDDMIAALRDAADELENMRKDGVALEPDGGAGGDYARLVTTDPEVAKKYGMVEESELWGDGPDEEGEGDAPETGP